MNLIRLFIKTSWQNIVLAVFFASLSGFSTTGLIALINLTLQGTNLFNHVLALGFLGLCGLLLMATTVSQIFISRLVEHVIYELRLLLTRRILACSLRQIEEIGIPRLLAALTQDLQAIADASVPISLLCVQTALLLGCLVYLSLLSLPLFYLTLILMPIGIISNQYLIYKGKSFLKYARKEQDNLFQHFRTATEGIKELKLHQQRRQAFFNEDLQITAAKFRRYRIRAMNLFAIGGSWGLVALFILIGLLLFVAPLVFAIPSSVRSGYALTIVFMLTPVRALLNILPDLVRANVALENINLLGLSLIAQTTDSESEILLTHQPKWNSLQLIGVSHGYRGEQEDSHFTLGPLDLILYPGELVFIVGGNGSGKSTLVKLLTGLYAPETGNIDFDGQPITEDNREWYRQQFSVIFSDFYLFDRLLGLDNSSYDWQIQEYLEKLQLHRKLKVNNGTFSTTTLSQGQRKRLALLTAYLENRSIYVFDEWASDQDPVFKKIFYTQLLPELKNRGKAVVAITHDDRYFDLADRIVKLDYGKVEYDRKLHHNN